MTEFTQGRWFNGREFTHGMVLSAKHTPLTLGKFFDACRIRNNNSVHKSMKYLWVSSALHSIELTKYPRSKKSMSRWSLKFWIKSKKKNENNLRFHCLDEDLHVCSDGAKVLFAGVDQNQYIHLESFWSRVLTRSGTIIFSYQVLILTLLICYVLFIYSCIKSRSKVTDGDQVWLHHWTSTGIYVFIND